MIPITAEEKASIYVFDIRVVILARQYVTALGRGSVLPKVNHYCIHVSNCGIWMVPILKTY
jgi:hypothetical protein